MDKSDSELLEDWDVVSSVYDTEQENNVIENKTDTQTESNIHTNVSVNNGDSECTTEASVKSSTEVDIKEITDVRIETPVSCDTREIVKDSDEINEADSVIEQTSEIDAASDQLTVTDNMEGRAETSDMEHISEVDVTEEAKTSDIIRQISPTDIVEEIRVDVTEEPKASDIYEEVSVTDIAEEIREDIENISPISSKIDAENTEVNIQKTEESILVEKPDDSATKNSYAKNEAAFDHKIKASVDYSNVDNSDDHIVNSSLDSSMEHVQIEHCEGSFVQNVPDLVEQENAAIESSSSDIDIIDENMEESVMSSFLHPLSLSITSSVDTSSVMTTPSEGDKEVKTEIRTQNINEPEETKSYVDKSPSYSQSSESYSQKSESFPSRPESFQKSKYRERDENVRPEPHRPHPQNATHGIVAGILEFIRNVTRFEWSILGGLMLCLYLTIVFNQTNIFAVIEKEDVVSQMKKMIDELKYDNKILKDQMLSEMKNEKVFSTFEHQIKELRKENSKFNHMLYDVAKVLEEQKDAQKRFEKREADYLAPFKKEINKLKEHINILKFDNEELQKQLVRMRYASYSQGGRDIEDDKTEKQKSETKVDETGSNEEIALDINSLKKWNELILLLSKELGLSENEPPMEEKSHSDSKNIKWYWKVFLQEFKGTFKDFKANVTSVISDYRKANEKAVSEIYKFVKDFFTVKEDNNQKSVPPGEESSQWKNIGDFVKDLSDKWTNIKDRIYTTDIKNFVRSFKKSGEADTSQDDYKSEKMRSPTYDYERKPVNTHFEPDRKHDKAASQSDSEDSKWMFKRAELRAELRDSEKEDEENWFLKRKKRTFQTGEVKF